MDAENKEPAQVLETVLQAIWARLPEQSWLPASAAARSGRYIRATDRQTAAKQWLSRCGLYCLLPMSTYGCLTSWASSRSSGVTVAVLGTNRLSKLWLLQMQARELDTSKSLGYVDLLQLILPKDALVSMQLSCLTGVSRKDTSHRSQQSYPHVDHQNVHVCS